MTYKQFVNTVLDQLKEAMNLQDYRIVVKYVKKIDPVYQIDESATAEVSCDKVYMDITVSLSKKHENRFNEGRYSEAANDLAHELSHVILDQYNDFAQSCIRRGEQTDLWKVDENTTQKLANIITKNIKLKIPNDKRTV